MTEENKSVYLYVKGEENINGSIRFSTNAPNGPVRIEERINGIWEHDKRFSKSDDKNIPSDEIGVTNQALLDVQGLKNRVKKLESAMQEAIDLRDSCCLQLLNELFDGKFKQLLEK